MLRKVNIGGAKRKGRWTATLYICLQYLSIVSKKFFPILLTIELYQSTIPANPALLDRLRRLSAPILRFASLPSLEWASFDYRPVSTCVPDKEDQTRGD